MTTATLSFRAAGTGSPLGPAAAMGPEFWAEVMHDLRSPLASILCLTEALRNGSSGSVNDRQRRQLGVVYTAALGLARVAGDVLELAGHDGAAWEAPATLSLAEVVESVREIVQPMAEVKGVTLELEAPESDHRCGPGLALSRVLLNLTANALKCTERGRVTVAARPRDEERVEFSVEDTGPGLDPEVVQALRDGLELERRRNGDGFSRSGLGLAIACKLVAAMGAELCVQSRPGEGTRFSFELELPRSEASPASGRASEDGRSGR